MPVKSSTDGVESPPKRPAHRSVYHALRSRILFGDLIPGQSVTILGLRDDLDAGMTPVREALRCLISEGALLRSGNRRVSVPELTENCVSQLEFMRKSLELKLLHLAMPRMTADLFKGLRVQDDALNRAISRGDVRGYLAGNYQFHSAIYAAAQAPILANTVDTLWLRFGPSLRVVCGRTGTLNLPDKHVDLMDALEMGQTDAAAHALEEDIHQGMAQIRLALQKDNSE